MPGNQRDLIEKYQRQLLEQSRNVFPGSFDPATERVYFETPRHRFIRRYREWGTRAWHDVNEENLEEHLATLYTNKSLILLGDEDDDVLSSISQPGLVLRMLEMLRLEAGQSVFELGAGSGWNAALMGRLVGPEGSVHSVEIFPEMARTAAENVGTLDLPHVRIVEADGGEGYAAGAPYDRAIFTAGAFDLPRPFYEQIREGGLLLIVIKIEGGYDNLFLLRKKADHFESLESLACGFVQMRGKYQIDSLEPIRLDALPGWADLKDRESSRTPFWWGGKGDQSLLYRTMGIRSFLGITEPTFRSFETENQEEGSGDQCHFGLWDEANTSLVLARGDELISHGSEAARERLLEAMHRWVDLGMPAAACFSLRVYPADHSLTAGENQWIVRRRESQFLWSLEL